VLRAYLKLLTRKMMASIESAVSRIDHNAVIKDLTGRADLSGSYLLMIIFSCLVALLGLLINSVAVVIGAMLISPLIGPIFTAALAFSMADLRLARNALKIIVASILLSVLVTAFFTLLSPLKAPTQEILSRTRPNIYDLLIAAFAGSAGAYALCTRVNYMFVTTGVAVSTAVIPPLSVVGYGVGTGQIAIALGGFLLFFTNLVAIVISSDIVFHIFRFRASMVAEQLYPGRRRIQILGGILALISVPLVYTLVMDIKKVKLTNHIDRVLKKHLDSKDRSRLTGFSFHQSNNELTVSASVNTVSYYDALAEKLIENDLKTALDRPVLVDLEQVIVKSGHVGPQSPTPSIPLVTAQQPKPESLATLQEKTIGRVREGCEEVKQYIKPYPISQCGIRFSTQNAPTTVTMTIARDYSFSDEERRWLNVALDKTLGEPLALELETEPFLPPMNLNKDGKLDEASRKALAVLKQFGDKDDWPRLVITAPNRAPVNGASKNKMVASLREYLIKDLGMPAAAISRGPDRGTDLLVRVEPSGQ
jgi:uncharacterized hydrophobic protein (TIGR00271 family)